jgi:hypothetical protein
LPKILDPWIVLVVRDISIYPTFGPRLKPLALSQFGLATQHWRRVFDFIGGNNFQEDTLLRRDTANGLGTLKKSKSSLCARCYSLGVTKTKTLVLISFEGWSAARGLCYCPSPTTSRRPTMLEALAGGVGWETLGPVEMPRIPKTCLHQLIEVYMCLAVERT